MQNWRRYGLSTVNCVELTTLIRLPVSFASDRIKVTCYGVEDSCVRTQGLALYARVPAQCDRAKSRNRGGMMKYWITLSGRLAAVALVALLSLAMISQASA